MKLIYAPSDQPEQTFDLQIDDLPALDLESIEEVGGSQWETLVEWVNLLDKGGFRACRVLLWVLLRQKNPDLDLNQVQPKLKELRFEVGEESGKDDEGTTEPDDSSTDSSSPKPDTEPSPSN